MAKKVKSSFKDPFGPAWHIRHSLWMLFFIPFGLLTWIPMIFLAIKLKIKYLYLFAVAYLVPFFLFVLCKYFNVQNLRLYEAVSSITLITWLLSIVHGNSLRKRYLLKLKADWKRSRKESLSDSAKQK